MFGRATITLGIGPHSSCLYVLLNMELDADMAKLASFCCCKKFPKTECPASSPQAWSLGQSPHGVGAHVDHSSEWSNSGWVLHIKIDSRLRPRIGLWGSRNEISRELTSLAVSVYFFHFFYPCTMTFSHPVSYLSLWLAWIFEAAWLHVFLLMS